jgi:hypothetical protein
MISHMTSLFKQVFGSRPGGSHHQSAILRGADDRALGQLNAISASLKDMPDEPFLQMPTEGEREKKTRTRPERLTGISVQLPSSSRAG